MAAFAGVDARRPRPALRLRVALRRMRLDRELAAGANPGNSELLALRAAQLVEPRIRRQLARGLRRAVASGSQRRGAGVPVCRAAVLEAGPALLALADDLVEIRDPEPRGVALALQLLTDGGGPLYRPWTPLELHAATERARYAL
ncbi:hypothetical protein OM076_29620 [Solirubrobacter ginsenosidimutans]|uniref:Uncharacterized protein n=1 Tax=Solirubrobacter ginsenosidimutans TaxID=490573 RepID=A0A9X3MWV2_9ACTN|nr:hypothetical protein [Solirubrobacter ginsenosidimutans]MDA0164466.1 hypothetical protein [Solirubrobacter ginsenosidimutans]